MVIRDTLSSHTPSPHRRLVPYDSVKNDNSSENNRFQQRQGSTRRLIKVDYSVIHNTDDDDDDDEEEEEDYTDSKVNSINSDDLAKVTQQNAMCRTGTTAGSANANSNSSCGIILQSYEKNLERRPISTPVSSTLQSMKPASCTIF